MEETPVIYDSPKCLQDPLPGFSSAPSGNRYGVSKIRSDRPVKAQLKSPLHIDQA